MKKVFINTPLTDEVIAGLKTGDEVYISGTIYTARDASHKRIVEDMHHNQKLPFDVNNQIIYYSGPTPARPGYIIGSTGPTTSGRMDIYAVQLLAAGLKGMIGKGHRSDTVKEAIRKHKAVYFAAIGGTAALISQCIKKSEVIAYPELGTEAIHKLEVENFPVIVINDIHGGDLYEQGKAEYAVAKKRH